MPQPPSSEINPGTGTAATAPYEQEGEFTALRRELQRLRILAETAPAILLDRDLESGTVWWNSAAYEMFGVYRQQAEADPRWWVERIHPDDRQAVVQQLQSLSSGQAGSLRLEMKMRASDGSYRTFDSGFTALTSTGETNSHTSSPPARLVVVMRDITPQRRAEQQRDRLFTLSPDLLAVIGMDGRFRQLNPAWEAAMGVPLERLAAGRFTDLIHPDDAPAAFRQLRNIVSGLPPQDFECRCVRPEGLDDPDGTPGETRWYSFRVRPELAHGNFHLRGKEITFAKQALEAAIASKTAAQIAKDAAVAAKEAAEAASNELASRLLQLQAESRAAAARILDLTPKLLTARLAGVQQLYVDQIEGASHGLRQAADRQAELPSSARLTAPAVPQAPQSPLQTPEPAAQTKSVEQPASSASLQALVDSVAEPTAAQPQIPEVQPPASANADRRPQSATAAKRILVVEDNKVNQKVAAGLLKNLGYTTDLASDGLEALAALECKAFDLVLMDCQMPEMDGFTATQELRRREQAILAGEPAAPDSSYARAANHRYAKYESPHIPVIAVTAHALSGDRERCLSNGMDDYLMKPINSNELRAMVEKTLSLVVRREQTRDQQAVRADLLTTA